MNRKWLSRSHRRVNVKHNTPKAVSLSKCHFHSRMCSAISAAATQSVRAAQGGSGPRTRPVVGAEVQGRPRALPAQRGWASAQSPRQHPRLQPCNAHPGTAVEGCLQLPRPQAATVAWYSPVKALQNAHKEFQLQLDTIPASPSLLSIEVSTRRSSAVRSHTQAWAPQFNPDYPPHRDKYNPRSVFQQEDHPQRANFQETKHTAGGPTAPPRRVLRCHRGHRLLASPHTACQRHPGTHRGHCWAWHLLPQVSFVKRKCKPSAEVQQEGMKKNLPRAPCQVCVRLPGWNCVRQISDSLHPQSSCSVLRTSLRGHAFSQEKYIQWLTEFIFTCKLETL